MSTKISVYNIAYSATDEEIIQFLQLVGPLKQSKEARNIQREKNSNKVFGYFQYVDSESALSAVRNLNKRDFKGRELTIKYNESEQGNNNNNNDQIRSSNNMQLLNNNEGKEQQQEQQIKEKLETIQDIEEYLENLSKPEKIFIIKQLKNLAEKDRPFVAAFLPKHPKITSIILKLQTELNMNPYQTIQTNPQFNNLQAPNIVQNHIRMEMRDQQQNKNNGNVTNIPRYNQQQQQQQQPYQQNYQQQQQQNYPINENQQNNFIYSQANNNKQPYQQNNNMYNNNNNNRNNNRNLNNNINRGAGNKYNNKYDQ